MALRSKVHNRAWLVLSEKRLQQGPIPDIAVHKLVSLVACDSIKVPHISGVGQLVQVYHWSRVLLHPLQNEVGADEARSSGDQDRLPHQYRSAPRRPTRSCPEAVTCQVNAQL